MNSTIGLRGLSTLASIKVGKAKTFGNTLKRTSKTKDPEDHADALTEALIEEIAAEALIEETVADVMIGEIATDALTEALIEEIVAEGMLIEAFLAEEEV
ncbi:hypothetical protein C2857_000657 [Epichloe festucae Fl1]|uniref:Uncharacterized protein n=1 Tax=Epichloe festucae (strain Fl1) TaxID=877507 RepID=A0A7S9PWV2_EPIFF|nr:hypothetical protein C2857_000657 [Epichloe festucae Fl1]